MERCNYCGERPARVHAKLEEDSYEHGWGLMVTHVCARCLLRYWHQEYNVLADWTRLTPDHVCILTQCTLPI